MLSLLIVFLTGKRFSWVEEKLGLNPTRTGIGDEKESSELEIDEFKDEIVRFPSSWSILKDRSSSL